MKDEQAITGVVERSPNKGGWYYVGMPQQALAALRASSGKNGSLPVVACLGTSTWRSTIMSRGNQQWYLALKADVREGENVAEGDEITLRVAPDFEKIRKLKEKA